MFSICDRDKFIIAHFDYREQIPVATESFHPELIMRSLDIIWWVKTEINIYLYFFLYDEMMIMVRNTVFLWMFKRISHLALKRFQIWGLIIWCHFFGVLCLTHIIWVWMSYYMLNDFVQWNGNTSKARVCWHYPYDCQRQYQIPPFKRRKIPMEEVSKNHNELKIKYYIELRKRREQQIYIGAMHAIAIWWNDELKYLLYRCSGSSYYSWRAS